ncbi:MAG: hypothetical protein ABJK43_04935 [Lentilitoribacter sp.]
MPLLPNNKAHDLGSKQPIDFSSIAASLLPQARSIVPELLPNGKRIGHEWSARNPNRVDRQLGSFLVNLNTGVWADFATGDKGGDLISLAAYIDQSSQAEAAVLMCRKYYVGGLQS